MSYTRLTLTVENKVGHLVLDRPDEYNRMPPAFWSEFPAALEEIDRRGDVRVLVVSSTGKHFSAGMANQTPRPAARSFKRPELVRDVLRERGRYVSAACTMMRAWIVAGRPRTPCKPLAGYGDWSDLCRQPLMWLGMADPAESLFEAMAEDPDRETLGRLLTAWQSVFGKNPAMVRDAIRQGRAFPDDYAELREVLHDIADERGEINRRKLGWWIRRHAGRIVDGRRFVRADGNRSAEAWRVQSVSPVMPVSLQPNRKSVTDATDACDAYARARRGD